MEEDLVEKHWTKRLSMFQWGLYELRAVLHYAK